MAIRQGARVPSNIFAEKHPSLSRKKTETSRIASQESYNKTNYNILV